MFSAMHQALKKHLGKIQKPADEVDQDHKMNGSDMAPEINDGAANMGESQMHHTGVGEIGPEHMAIMEKLMGHSPASSMHPGRDPMSFDEKAHEKMASIMKHKKESGKY